MFREIIDKIIKKPQEDEFEYIEEVKHDTVMTMVNGKLVEVTTDGSEVRK